MSEQPERDFTLTDIGLILLSQTKLLKRILQIIEEDSKLDGTTVTNVFTIPNNAQVVKFDFVEAMHRNIPTNVTFDVPLVPVQQMVLKNIGPGNLFYSTNKFLNQLEAASVLSPGETREIRLKKRAIKQLNLTANNGACQVRLELLI